MRRVVVFMIWAMLGCEAEPAQILPDIGPGRDMGDSFVFIDLGVVDQMVDQVIDAAPDMQIDAAPPAECTFSDKPTLTQLTILHSNDGRSALVTEGQTGGIARFVSVMRDLRRRAGVNDIPVLALTTGDNVLAGPSFAASLEQGPPYLDAIGLAAAGFDAMALGNHDFDFGPDVLGAFISSFDTAVERFDGVAELTAPVVLGTNLRVANEPALAALRSAERIVPHTLVNGIGLIGVSSPEIVQISSPGDIEFDLPRGAIESAVRALQGQNAEIIVLISHLRDTELEARLAREIDGLDIVIAGGSDDLLANPDTLLHAGDVSAGPYPRVVCGQDGRAVLMVTTGGGYRYVGRLTVAFDNDGFVTAVDPESGPVPVTRVGPQAIEADEFVEMTVAEPVRAALQTFADNEVALSGVELDGRRDSLRQGETNLGSLIADALLWEVEEYVFGTDDPQPDIGLLNAGAIRSNSVLAPGSITELDTFAMLPFASFVVQVPAVSRAELKAILEHGVAQAGAGAGQFPQVAGLRFVWDPNRPARLLGFDGQLVQAGERIRSVELLDGTPLVTNGSVVDGDPLNIATLDFLSRGGDGYPFATGGTAFGVSYQQALRDYVAGGLEGEISAARYPAGGLGRIVRQE